MVGHWLKLMLTVFNAFFMYITTKWSYHSVVRDFLISLLSEPHRTEAALFSGSPQRCTIEGFGPESFRQRFPLGSSWRRRMHSFKWPPDDKDIQFLCSTYHYTCGSDDSSLLFFFLTYDVVGQTLWGSMVYKEQEIGYTRKHGNSHNLDYE